MRPVIGITAPGLGNEAAVKRAGGAPKRIYDMFEFIEDDYDRAAQIVAHGKLAGILIPGGSDIDTWRLGH